MRSGGGCVPVRSGAVSRLTCTPPQGHEPGADEDPAYGTGGVG